MIPEGRERKCLRRILQLEGTNQPCGSRSVSTRRLLRHWPVRALRAYLRSPGSATSEGFSIAQMLITPYPHPHFSQPFPRTASTPSLAMIGTIATPATGSAHHQPKSAFNSSPPKRIAERYVQKSACLALPSLRRYRSLPLPAALLSPIVA